MKHNAFRWIPAVLRAAGQRLHARQVPPQSLRAANSLPHLLPPPPNRTA